MIGAMKVEQNSIFWTLFFCYFLSFGLVIQARAQAGHHGSTGGISVAIAEDVVNHQPVNRMTEFKETDSSVALAFKNNSGSFKFNSLDIVAEIVEGYDLNTKLMSGSLQTPSGQWNSVVIDAPPGGFAIGTYRVDLDGRATARFTVISRFDTAETKDDDFDFGRPNIALKALGGDVRVSSSWPEPQWQSAHLNDGIGYTKVLNDRDKCGNCGWAAKDTDRSPSIVASFREEKTAVVGDIVLDTRRFVPPNTYFDQISDNFPKLVRVSASTTDRNSGFTGIGTFRLKREFRRHAIMFEEPFEAKFLKIDILETYGDEVVVMEMEVYEATGDGPSIVSGFDANIALPALGGSLVTYSGYNDQWTAARLFDDDDSTSWQSFDQYFPQDFTIAFKQDRIANIDRIEVVLSQRSGPRSWPSELAVAISEETPLDGFVEIGRFPVSAKSDRLSLPVGRKARFVKLRVLGNFDADRTTIGEVRVFEQNGLTPQSVLFAEDASTAQSSDLLIKSAPPPANESEPNNDLATAMLLRIDENLVGSIDPLGERDVFEIPDLGNDANALTLQYNGIPNIRHRIELLDEAGKVLSAFDPGDLPARNATLTFRLKGTEKYLRLSEPPASVVVIWDTSGSMKGSESDLERAVRQYIRRAPEQQAMQLIRFSNDVEVSPTGFTADKSRLENWLRGKFKPEGGTSLYDAISSGLDLLESRHGNKAILVMTDGAHNGPMWHNDLWRKIDDSKVRLYTIGLGSGLSEYSTEFASTGNRILRHFALATDGESFSAAESSALQKFYEDIANDLSKPATYVLDPTVERGEGQVRVTSIGEQIPSAAMPDLNLVFDMSGSMREPTSNGKSRIDVGRDSWRSTSVTIPDGAPFKMMFYGSELKEKDGKDIACDDIKTVFEGEFDQQKVGRLLQDQRPLYGATPLVGSIEKVVRDAKPGAIIVIITDGKDECADDPVGRMEALYLEGVSDLNINIIGFDVGNPDVESSIRAIAGAIHAEFFLAENAEELANLLKEAFTAPYRLVDSSGEIAVKGKIGSPPQLAPTGTYVLEIETGDKLHRVDNVQVSADLTTSIAIKKVGAEMDINVSKPKPFDLRHECGIEAARLPWTVRDVQNSLIGLVDKGVLPETAHPGGADNSEGPATRAAMANAAEHLDVAWDNEKSSRLILVQNLHCLAVANGKFRSIPKPEVDSLAKGKP